MKRHFPLLMLGFCLSTLGLFFPFSALQAAENPLVGKTLEPHPRLFLKAGEETLLRQRIQADPYWLNLHQRILTECDTLLTQAPQQRVKIGKRLLQTSRSMLRNIFFLSYAYRLTEDLRYAQRAEQEMLAAARFSDWNPSHFLDVGEMMMGLGIGYDWLYGVLPPASRTEIAEAMYRLGLRESEKTKASWVKGDNNWNQVCHGGTVVAALALWETYPVLGAALVKRAIENVPYALKAYAPDGAYPEGAGYWEYGTSYTVAMLDALESCFGQDYGLSRSPGFLASALYAQQMITPTLGIFSYADNSPSAAFSPTVFFFYKKSQDPRLLFHQRALYLQEQKKVEPGYARHRFLPFALIWGVQASASLQHPPVPEQLFYMAGGENPVAVMRSGWNDRSAIYFGVKGGRANTNHAHMDAGSFYFQSKGVKWALDLGAENYTNIEAQGIGLWDRKQNSERWKVYRYNNFVHNTLTVNQQWHKVSGEATFTDTSSDVRQMKARLDLSPVFEGQLEHINRTCLFTDTSVAVVRDDLRTNEQAATIVWNMLTEATAIVRLSPTLIKLSKGKQDLFMQVQATDAFEWATGPATPTTTYENPNKGIQFLRLIFEVPAHTRCNIQVSFYASKPIE